MTQAAIPGSLEPVSLEPEALARSPGLYALALRRLLRHRLGRLGLAVLLLLALAALLAPWLAPYDPTLPDYDALLAAPSAVHPFGTDDLGRDILSRTLWGAQVSYVVMAASVGSALLVGSALGLLSGYVGGWVDAVVMRVMDGLLAFPMLILALGAIAVLGPDLQNAMMAIAIVNVPGFVRLVRGQVLLVKRLDHVQAALALGAPDWRVVLRHIWPTLAGHVIVYASLRASATLLTESSLAFLGLGAQPPTPSWGAMLADAMQHWDAWWMSVAPGCAIFISVLALNSLGDGLRDSLDARLPD